MSDIKEKLEKAVEDILEKALPDIEVTVRMVNINYGRSKNIFSACEPLNEYAWLVDQKQYQCRDGD